MLISLLVWVYAGAIFYLLGSFTLTIIEKISKKDIILH